MCSATRRLVLPINPPSNRAICLSRCASHRPLEAPAPPVLMGTLLPVALKPSSPAHTCSVAAEGFNCRLPSTSLALHHLHVRECDKHH
ncbi:hypothetical protein B0T17DRAFT_538240 [Bombardia bombarda]|uniref:Uncharacterized protein n=1 Tax=Bombardia bombarda TaxID=252184 RepID=A0AA39WNB0_9PEZI|nr:hypothetical protein B0T17DRAFT_538240 [Bombardia bombarda]